MALPPKLKRENDDPDLNRTQMELDKMIRDFQLSKTTMWSTLITINGIFLAFFSVFFNRNMFTKCTEMPLAISIVLPILLTFLLFFMNYYLKREAVKTAKLIFEWTRKKINNEDGLSLAREIHIREDKRNKDEIKLEEIIKWFQISAITLTVFSCVYICILTMFSDP